MSWIQENKFTAALAGVTLVGSIALFTLAHGKSGDLEEAQDLLSRALRKEKDLQEGVPFPNPSNAEAIAENVEDFEEASNRLQTDFMAYKPAAEDVKDFAPDQFSKMVSDYRERLDAAFGENGTSLPEGGLYGFEAYRSTFPRPEATGELSYQMKALEWLFSDLAQQEPEALINVVRPAIAVESKPKEERRRARSAKADEKIYDVYPIELSFRCSEDQLKAFLEDIASSKEYYFAVNAMRIQNERQTPPNASDAKFPVAEQSAAPQGFDNFGGFGEGVDDEAAGAEVQVVAPAVASDSDETRLLMPILGSEKINVYLKLDLIVLKQGSKVALEEEKKAQLSKGSEEEA